MAAARRRANAGPSRDDIPGVSVENRDIYREIFMNDDSDEEFLGFGPDDVNNNEDLAAETDSDSDNETDPMDEFTANKWRLGDRVIRDNFVFTGNSGIKVDIPENPSPLDFIAIFLTYDFFETVTYQTNLYATSYLRSHRISPHSRFRKWPADGIPIEDMKCFISLLISMGLLHQEDIQDYWSKDDVLRTPFFPSVMPRDHFLNILSFFHLCDNDNYVPRGQDGYNPLFKLGTVYEDILSKFQAAYYPGQNLSIDEAMIPFRGKVHMRVYAKDKPCKYGLKAYSLCDSGNAYCSQFQLYTGKSNQQASTFGRTYDIVCGLLQPYLNKRHILFTDNYYTSPILARFLLDNGTGITGTVRGNRKGMPKIVKEKKLKTKGELIAMTNGPFVVVKLKDSKDVTLLSTVHTSKKVNIGKRDNHGNPICRLEMQHEYNR